MSFAPITEYGAPYTCIERSIVGVFTEVDNKLTFEYSRLRANEVSPFPGYETKVWLFNGEFRWARILQTVAYIVTDENPDGSPVHEKWNIKNHRVYAN